jgi:hypothetical protein
MSEVWCIKHDARHREAFEQMSRGARRRFRGAGHDVDIYVFGADNAPLVAEVKGRKNGAGFTTLERWLGEYDL